MEIQKSNIDTSRFENWEERNKIRSNERYHSMVEQNFQIKKAESLLAHLAKHWGFDTPIPAFEFEKVDFPYLVCTGGTIREDSFAFVVGKYCYTFFENFTIKIYEHV
jgi:hypothetical protein